MVDGVIYMLFRYEITSIGFVRFEVIVKVIPVCFSAIEARFGVGAFVVGVGIDYNKIVIRG